MLVIKRIAVIYRADWIEKVQRYVVELSVVHGKKGTYWLSAKQFEKSLVPTMQDDVYGRKDSYAVFDMGTDKPRFVWASNDCDWLSKAFGAKFEGEYKIPELKVPDTVEIDAELKDDIA